MPTGVTPVTAMALLACCLNGAPVFAQSSPSGPFRGLFRLDGERPARSSSLDLFLSVYGASDTDIYGSVDSGPQDPRLNLEGYYAGASADLSFQKSGTLGSIAAAATASTRYQPELGQMDGATFDGAVTGTRMFGTRNWVTVAQDAYYMPDYRFSLFEGPVAEGATDAPVDFVVTNRPLRGFGTQAAFGHRLRQRTTMGLQYGYRFSEFVDGDGDLSGHNASAQIEHRMTRYTTLEAGYSFRQYMRPGQTVPSRLHDVQGGVAYSRQLSLAGRRTTLTATPSWSVLADRASYRLFLGGSVDLRHDLGRTWFATAGYQRGIRFVPGLQAPATADSISAGIGGFMSRRVHLAAGMGYTSGTVLLGVPDDSGYHTLNAQARLRVALSRQLALYAQFVHYDYLFQPIVPLPDGFAHDLDGQSIRVGLTVWLPLR